MNQYDELLFELLKTKGFTELLSDDGKILVDVHHAVNLILSTHQIIPKSSISYEYGYQRAKTIVGIGDEAAFGGYKIDMASLRTVPVRHYLRQPKDQRSWEEVQRPDASLLS